MVNFPAKVCHPPVKTKNMELYNRYIRNKIPEQKPTFILLVGGPSSGKTSSIRKIFTDPTNAHLGDINNYIYIDIDDIRMESKEYRENINGVSASKSMPHLGLTPTQWLWGQSTGTVGQYQYLTENGFVNRQNEFVASMHSVGGPNCREYTWPLTWSGQETLTNKFAKAGYNIIYNTICANANQCTRILDNVLKLNPNYRMFIIFIQTNVETAVTRAQGRAVKEGRFTPPHFIRQDYTNLWHPSNIGILKQYEAAHTNVSIEAYDNNGPALKHIILR